jgi:ATP-dependent DNA ligase
MEALPARELPAGREWQYEPKWDGFRCLAFRSQDRANLMSKSGKPLTRYFPELVEALLALKARQFVLDGEIVIAINGKLSFDDLLLRIHPASSRIQKLSESTPCMYLVFDLLVDEASRSLTAVPLEKRRQKLEAFAGKFLKSNAIIHLSPTTNDLDMARSWFNAGVGLDGVIAKRRDLPYESGERTGMQKIKSQRTADCVVGGFRYLEKQPFVGSLLLGLYDDAGKLDHVGFTSSIHSSDRLALTRKLKKLIRPPGFTGRAPGGASRWSTRRSNSWEPLAPELVVEVQFDHFSGRRFRHGTKLLRWRPDKAPRSCSMKQVERENLAIVNLLE